MSMFSQVGTFRERAFRFLPLAAFAVLLACTDSEEEPLELKDLSITPSHARVDTVIEVEFVASRAALGVPTVEVADMRALQSDWSHTDDGGVRYVYAYEVTGEEEEGEASVVVSAEAREGGRITLEGSVVLDFTPPAITDLVGPDSPTEETHAEFTFGCSEPGCVFFCMVIDSTGRRIHSRAECESGVRYDDLSDDDLTFSVMAVDLAGNEGEPETWSWAIDSAGLPEVHSLQGPPDPTYETTATFTFRCSRNDCVYACGLEGAAQGEVSEVQECESGVTYEDLLDDTYTFTVTASDPYGNESEPATWTWTLLPPPAASLVVSGIASPIEAGTSADVSVEVLDADGNRAKGYEGTVSFASSDPQAELPEDYTFTIADHGFVTLDDAVVLKTAGMQFVTATDHAAEMEGTQEDIEVQASTAAALVFGVQPAGAVEGEHMSPPVEVQIVDAYGNWVQDATAEVELELDGGTEGAVLSGGAGKDAVDGVAIFDELSIDLLGTDYVLLAKSDDFDEAESLPFDVVEHAEMDFVFPGRTWPGNPADLDMDVFGAAFCSGTKVIWDVGGDEIEIEPWDVQSDRITVTLTTDFWLDREGPVEVAVEQYGVLSEESFEFVIGGVLPDSGQEYCYDLTGELAMCPGPGEDLFGQDAQHGWDLHVEPGERYALAGSAANPVVTDYITGLEWQGCSAGLTGEACDAGNENVMSVADASAYCTDLDWDGHADWRLPTVKELSSIVDYGASEPAADLYWFPETAAGHWSADSRGEDQAMQVVFDDGGVSIHDDVEDARVRCVRGAFESPMPNEAYFIRSEDVSIPVVWELDTGLMWQGCHSGLTGQDCEQADGESVRSWADALDYCAGLEWSGYDDWRLPSVGELRSIVDYGSTNGAFDSEALPETALDFYWSSSTNAGGAEQAWALDFEHGSVFSSGKIEDHHVRCVRGGAPDLFNPFGIGPYVVELIDVERNEDGSPRAFRLYEPRDIEGDVPVVHFLHGFQLEHTYFDDMLSHLASHGFIVVSSQSDHSMLGGGTSDEEADAVLAFIDWLKTDLPARVSDKTPDFDRFGVSGHSRGGKVTTHVLNERSDLALAFFGVDPVDAEPPMGEDPPSLDQPLLFEGASLFLGTELGPQSQGLFGEPCAPEGTNSVQFFESYPSPSWHVIAEGVGHMDMIDEDDLEECSSGSFLFPGVCEACIASNDKAVNTLFRTYVGGLMVSFFSATLKGEEIYEEILDDDSAHPFPLTVHETKQPVSPPDE